MRSKAAIRSHPIHPMLVAFPIGLFITSLIFDLIASARGNAPLADAGWYCVIAGLCFGVAAAIPGALDLFSVFNDHCTHKGGPLSNGALVGCTVQCPWHGSQFNVDTGRVVNGPAFEAYDVEVRSGNVFVRPRRGEQEKKAA